MRVKIHDKVASIVAEYGDEKYALFCVDSKKPLDTENEYKLFMTANSIIELSDEINVIAENVRRKIKAKR